MQRREEGDVRMPADRLAQRQRAIGGEFGEQLVGQRAKAFVLFLRGLGVDRRRRRLLRPPERRCSGRRCRDAVFAFVDDDLRLGERRFVLRADIAALDAKLAGTVDADEGAGAGDIFGGIDDRALLESLERRFDLGKPGVDLLGDLVGVRIGRLELVGFGTKRLARRRFFLAQRLAFALEMAKPIGVAIGKVGRDLDPFPALGADRLGVAFELLGDEPIEEARVLQPAAVVALEEIAHDRAAGGDIVLAHISRALVGGAHGALGEHAADLIGLLAVGALDRLPDLLLALVVRD